MRCWDPRIGKVAHQLGIIGDGEETILGGVSLPPGREEELGALTASLLRLVTSIPERLFGGSYRETARAIGYPSEAAEALLALGVETDSRKLFARGDVLSSRGAHKFVELNIGSPVSGQTHASLPRLAGLPQSTRDAQAAWAARVAGGAGVAREKRTSEHLVFVDDRANAAGMASFCASMLREVGELIGREVPFCAQTDLSWDGERLTLRGERVERLYTWFSDKDVLADRASYAPLFEAAARGAVEIVMPPATLLLASKGMLALLWSLVGTGRLGPPEEALVRDHIPKTLWVTSANAAELRAQRAHYVSKPIDECGGRGVLIGRETSDAAWGRHVERLATSGDRQAVVFQELVDSDTHLVRLVGESGATRDVTCRVLLGPYVYGDEYLGTTVRCAAAAGTAVINYANGAVVGPLSP